MFSLHCPMEYTSPHLRQARGRCSQACCSGGLLDLATWLMDLNISLRSRNGFILPSCCLVHIQQLLSKLLHEPCVILPSQESFVIQDQVMDRQRCLQPLDDGFAQRPVSATAIFFSVSSSVRPLPS